MATWSPTEASPESAGDWWRPPSPPAELAESTVYEADVPVVMRRRGCTMRVRISSFAEDKAWPSPPSHVGSISAI